MIDPRQFPDVDIVQAPIGGRGIVTILRGGWTRADAKTYMDEAVRQFVENKLINQFVEIHLDIPQVRVIIEGINDIDYQPIQEFVETLCRNNGSR